MDKHMMTEKEMKKNMISEKIRKLMHEGKPQRQAIAIAMSMARKRKKKK